MSEPVDRKKAVFDTGVVLQSAISNAGPAASCLRLLAAGKIIVPLSPQVREEYADVLTRPVVIAKNPLLTPERANLILRIIDLKTTPVTVIRPYLQYPRDPNDEKILNLAIQEEVDFLVTRDKHLLVLRSSSDFKRLYPYMTVVDPLTFIQTIDE